MNNNIKRGVWVGVMLLGGLGLVVSAQGASFDCGKAGTKVEHIICDNPEISKLDDELSQSYKAGAAPIQAEPLLLTVSAEGDVHRYGGPLTELLPSLKEAGFVEVSGMAVKTGDIDHPLETSTSVYGIEWCLFKANKKPVVTKRCVYGIQSVIKRDDKGKAIFKMEDALDFVPTSGFEFLDADTECASKLYPYRSVVAIGRWKDRKPPKVGGYAYAIKQAWIIDPDSKKFIEISTKDVSCEINEDRD